MAQKPFRRDLLILEIDKRLDLLEKMDHFHQAMTIDQLDHSATDKLVAFGRYQELLDMRSKFK